MSCLVHLKQLADMFFRSACPAAAGRLLSVQGINAKVASIALAGWGVGVFHGIQF